MSNTASGGGGIRKGDFRGWRAPSYLGELSYFLAHLEMEILVIFHAELRRSGRGRRGGGEFPGTRGGAAAVIMLLPAHPWCRHLPQLKRPCQQLCQEGDRKTQGGGGRGSLWLGQGEAPPPPTHAGSRPPHRLISRPLPRPSLCISLGLLHHCPKRGERLSLRSG